MSGRVHAKRNTALLLASMRRNSQKVMGIICRVSLSLDALRLVALSLKVVTHQSSRPSLHPVSSRQNILDVSAVDIALDPSFNTSLSLTASQYAESPRAPASHAHSPVS